MLIWDLAQHDAAGLDLDAPEAITGAWRYPPTAKFDRLLRHVRVPLGLLTNREEIRLVYAPHGESTGHLTFRLNDMAEVGGRPILDAFVSLLSAHRFFGGLEDATPRALLEESRKRQANVTNELASQVFDALQVLLAGFQAAAERDPEHYGQVFGDALEREDDHVYRGLLTVMLRLVFLLFAEDRSLLPSREADLRRTPQRPRAIRALAGGRRRAPGLDGAALRRLGPAPRALPRRLHRRRSRRAAHAAAARRPLQPAPLSVS
ncbi:MAG: hypothetical protein M5U28_14045 [Sandaracinaceae bacterium]|nr:hypothetical protein [Sandaracinaceae bacterium]